MDKIKSVRIKEIYRKYQVLHDEIHELEQQTKTLMSRRERLSQELEETRNEEKVLINKIEEEIGRSVTQDDLIEIIKTDE